LLNYDDLLAARFKEGGRGPLFYDCWGICEEVARRAGTKMVSFENWISSISERDRIIKGFAGSDKFVRLDKAEPFCIVGLTNAGGRKVKHLGIVLEDCKSFIHIRRKVGVAITRLSDEQYAGRIYGFFKYVGK